MVQKFENGPSMLKCYEEIIRILGKRDNKATSDMTKLIALAYLAKKQ